MATDQRSDAFQLFRQEQAPLLFDLALRHSGDHVTASACVDAVFSELSGHWSDIDDPLRFIRRAAVLFVCRAHRRALRHVVRRRRAPGTRAVDRWSARTAVV
ncbi:MAG TPA: hypothetical protein VFZ70_18460 [Euzebyales bacterium]